MVIHPLVLWEHVNIPVILYTDFHYCFNLFVVYLSEMKFSVPFLREKKSELLRFGYVMILVSRFLGSKNSNLETDLRKFAVTDAIYMMDRILEVIGINIFESDPPFGI